MCNLLRVLRACGRARCRAGHRTDHTQFCFPIVVSYSHDIAEEEEDVVADMGLVAVRLPVVKCPITMDAAQSL